MNKIDLIIDALIAFDVMAHEQKIPVYIDEAHKALAAARELRAMKPEGISPINGVSLYALDEVKHD